MVYKGNTQVESLLTKCATVTSITVNRKQEAMVMHIPNASSESVVSCFGCTTVHWSVHLGSNVCPSVYKLQLISVLVYTLNYTR